MKSNRFEMGNDVIITADEIKLILDRYRIGKKPLAKLLGWGETTIIRYMEGDIPTNEYSNKLKSILDDPEYYYDLLTKRQECLTGVAFKKSKKAVLSKIMASRIYAVTYYIINRCGAEICASYIQFLLYYIQVFSLALYDREMFQEEYAINNEHVPYLKLFEDMKRSGIHTLDMEEDYLDPEDTQLIDTILECLTWYGPRALQTLMTFEKSTFKISRDKYNNKIISKDTLRSYFKEICEQYSITDLKDICRYPERRLLEIKEMNGKQ